MQLKVFDADNLCRQIPFGTRLPNYYWRGKFPLFVDVSSKTASGQPEMAAPRLLVLLLLTLMITAPWETPVSSLNDPGCCR